MSAEPSMEDILSSIKRIIAEEEPAVGRRSPEAPARAPEPVRVGHDAEDEVLELSHPMPSPPVRPALAETPPTPQSAGVAPAAVQSAPEPVSADPDPLLSPAAADATRGALQSLSKLMVKSEAPSDGTVEGLIRDMLRPMLREWLDANLPELVEAMVAREIARISGGRP